MCVCVGLSGEGSRAFLCWVPSRSTDSIAPPTSLQGCEWLDGLGDPGPGLGAVGLWGESRKSWQPERREAAWQQQTAGGRGQKSRECKHPCGSGVLGRAGRRAGERARSSPGTKRTFHTLAWRDLQPARCNGGGLCAAPTLEPRSLKMISTSKIFPNCCRDRERRGGRQEKGVTTAAALSLPLPRCHQDQGKKTPGMPSPSSCGEGLCLP